MHFVLSFRSADELNDDHVLRYPYKLHTHRRSEREVDACKNHPYGLNTNVKYPAHPRVNLTESSLSSAETVKGDKDKHNDIYLPLVERHHTTKEVGPYSWEKRDVLLHVMYVNNPVETVSIYEPLHDGTCKLDGLQTATVCQSAASRRCLLAVNAGLFNTSTGQCYGKYHIP